MRTTIAVAVETQALPADIGEVDYYRTIRWAIELTNNTASLEAQRDVQIALAALVRNIEDTLRTYGYWADPEERASYDRVVACQRWVQAITADNWLLTLFQLRWLDRSRLPVRTATPTPTQLAMPTAVASAESAPKLQSVPAPAPAPAPAPQPAVPPKRTRQNRTPEERREICAYADAHTAQAAAEKFHCSMSAIVLWRRALRAVGSSAEPVSA